MTKEASPADIEKFCRKLEQFSAGLSDMERTLLKSLLEGEEPPDKALGQVHGAVITFAEVAPKLNASFFLRKIFVHTLADW
jgi:hypothetical protein